MKKILIGVLLGLAALWLILSSGVGSFNKYAEFVSPLSQPAARFQYPIDWKVQVDQGKIENYTQVLVEGPRNTKDTYTTTFIVREIPVNDKFKTLASLKQNRLDHVYNRAAVSETKEITLDQHDSDSLIAARVLPPLGLKGLKPIPVDLKSRHVFTENNQKLYEIIFNADVELFDKYAGDFEHLLKTFRFE